MPASRPFLKHEVADRLLRGQRQGAFFVLLFGEGYHIRSLQLLQNVKEVVDGEAGHGENAAEMAIIDLEYLRFFESYGALFAGGCLLLGGGGELVAVVY